MSVPGPGGLVESRPELHTELVMATRGCSWNSIGNKAIIPTWRTPHRTPLSPPPNTPVERDLPSTRPSLIVVQRQRRRHGTRQRTAGSTNVVSKCDRVTSSPGVLRARLARDLDTTAGHREHLLPATAKPDRHLEEAALALHWLWFNAVNQRQDPRRYGMTGSLSYGRRARARDKVAEAAYDSRVDTERGVRAADERSRS